MEGCIVPECYFDTVLVKAILGSDKALNHKKGCNNVMRVMDVGRLKDQFAVGIVDKDKRELDYLKQFATFECEKLILHKHESRDHYVIQLSPPLERWILEVAGEAGIDLESLSLPKDVELLKKVTKSETASEAPDLKHLCKRLLQSEHKVIKVFSFWMRSLEQHRYKADINQLINA